jgi:hypothetical protein
MTLPAAAVLAGPDDPATASITTGGTAVINAGSYSVPVNVAAAGDPLTTIETPDGPVTIRAPSQAVAATGSDAVLAVVDPTHRLVDEFWRASPAGDARWTAERHVRAQLAGPGTIEGTRAAGFSVLAGLIRASDLDSGSIAHALVLAIPAEKARRGPVWPAVGEDAYADRYGGVIPLGTRFAIPLSVDLGAQGLSPEGLALGRALQRYGAFVGDTTAPGTSDSIILVAEPTLEGGAALEALRTDLVRLRPLLRRVIGDGGDG